MKNTDIDKLFKILCDLNPSPVTELKYTNEYTLLVAIILSAQSTDKGVNKATEKLFAIVDSAQKMISLGEEALKKYINTIGLFNAKAKNIIGMSRCIVEYHGGRIPHTLEELMKLPGVGQKTANVWLNCALGQPTIAVDTHVFRVANRLGLCKANNPLKTEIALQKNIPQKWKKNAHHWLILHGRYVCKAQKPACNACCISHLCNYYKIKEAA